ncbi:hypothetical protein [Planococcus sp. CAU13]|uniref:hypothetical protein n=1 Tax=Planococcus sp. CAU13 TaxID=1541197 RepID=UPI00052FDF85|nr:hypothetical protein [Planococcus sp. CAU13]
MNSILFYLIPLVVYAIVNNTVDSLYWPHFLMLLLSFIVFQLARLRYPKDRIPSTAKVAQGAFYVLTIAFIFRDQFLNPLFINVFLGIAIGLVIIEILQGKKQAFK